MKNTDVYLTVSPHIRRSAVEAPCPAHPKILLPRTARSDAPACPVAFRRSPGILTDENHNAGIRLANSLHTHIDLRIERHLPVVPFCPMDMGEPSAPKCVQELMLDRSKINNLLRCISNYGKMHAADVLGNHLIPIAWGAWPLARHVARSEGSAETGGAGAVSQPWDLG